MTRVWAAGVAIGLKISRIQFKALWRVTPKLERLVSKLLPINGLAAGAITLGEVSALCLGFRV